jgi:hypothetical protein
MIVLYLTHMVQLAVCFTNAPLNHKPTIQPAAPKYGGLNPTLK